MNLPVTVLDILVILVVLVSAGYAAWRGFLSETLGIFAWVAAAFGCLYFGPYLSPMMRGFINTFWLADIVAYAVVFLAVFIPLSFMSHRFSESVKHSPIGPLDRALGIAFGVVRGLVVLAIAYLAYTYFVPMREHPRWVTEARSLPVIQSTGDVLLTLVPNHTRSNFATGAPERYEGRNGDAIGNLIRDQDNGGNGGGSAAEATPSSQPDNYREKPADQPATQPRKKGYGATDRRALDRLFEKADGAK